jgi:acyl carrier protein
MSDVATEVVAIISKKKRVSKKTVELSDRLPDLGLQSLDAVEMIFDLEEKFDVQIPYNANAEKAPAEVETVADIVATVESLLAQKRRS